MNPLEDFLDAERKRVFAPGPFFTERVLARLGRVEGRESEIWEVIPTSTRPVFALALVLIFCFVVVQVIIPQVPQRGLIEAYLDPDQSPGERFLYNEGDVPSGQEFLDQLIVQEEQK
jgi:hypothetical protein